MRGQIATRAALAAMAVVALLVVGWLVARATAGDGKEESIEVQFGMEHAGSPFPPGAEHDASDHARDSIVPRNIVIERGGSVTFEVEPFHNPAVYAPGKTPETVVVSDATLEDLTLPCVQEPLTDFVINDPEGRLALGPGQSCEEQSWTTPPGTFEEPGKYLLICTTTPHFKVGMWAWVTVR